MKKRKEKELLSETQLRELSEWYRHDKDCKKEVKNGKL